MTAQATEKPVRTAGYLPPPCAEHDGTHRLVPYAPFRTSEPGDYDLTASGPKDKKPLWRRCLKWIAAIAIVL